MLVYILPLRWIVKLEGFCWCCIFPYTQLASLVQASIQCCLGISYTVCRESNISQTSKEV